MGGECDTKSSVFFFLFFFYPGCRHDAVEVAPPPLRHEILEISCRAGYHLLGTPNSDQPHHIIL